MSILRRKEIVVIITSFCGLLVMFDYFLTLPQSLSSLATAITTWGLIIGNFAFALGLINITRVHYTTINKRTPGRWIYSVVLLLSLATMVLVGIILGQNHPIYSWLFTNALLPLDATMYSILGFFIVSAAFRSFKAKNLESTILILSALMVMLTNAPIGEAIWPGFPVIGKWIMTVPVTAGMRSIIIGVAVGSLVYALKVITGKETRYVGAD